MGGAGVDEVEGVVRISFGFEFDSVWVRVWFDFRVGRGGTGFDKSRVGKRREEEGSDCDCDN